MWRANRGASGNDGLNREPPRLVVLSKLEPRPWTADTIAWPVLSPPVFVRATAVAPPFPIIPLMEVLPEPATANVSVPAVPPHSVVDPTGVGDAFRGGLLKGLAMDAGLETACRLGSVAAAYVLEHLGGQSHAYTWEEFRARYAKHFGALVSKLTQSTVNSRTSEPKT